MRRTEKQKRDKNTMPIWAPPIPATFEKVDKTFNIGMVEDDNRTGIHYIRGEITINPPGKQPGQKQRRNEE